MKKLGDILGQRGADDKGLISEAETRHFVEQWWHKELKDEAVFCESVSGGEVVARVTSALLAQEVYVREYDLGQALQESCGFELKGLRVRQ